MPLIHGHAPNRHRSKEWRAWHNMRSRCQYPSTSAWSDYGGRGIKVCETWARPSGFPAFLADIGLAPSPRHSLGRIDNDGDYEPGNVRWEEPTQQANNKRDSRLLTALGETKTLNDWAQSSGISSHTIAGRIDRDGWSVEAAVSKPVRFKGRSTPRLLTLNGETMTLSDWAMRTGISRAGLKQRLDDLGWSVEKTLTTPSRLRQE
jgi:hypothetical protein